MSNNKRRFYFHTQNTLLDHIKKERQNFVEAIIFSTVQVLYINTTFLLLKKLHEKLATTKTIPLTEHYNAFIVFFKYCDIFITAVSEN